jgi:hypothetical protein
MFDRRERVRASFTRPIVPSLLHLALGNLIDPQIMNARPFSQRVILQPIRIVQRDEALAVWGDDLLYPRLNRFSPFRSEFCREKAASRRSLQ